MGNNTYFYLGAYLAIETKPIVKLSHEWYCVSHPKNTTTLTQAYCYQCGKLMERLPSIEVYPDWIYLENELPKIFEEEMRELTHRDSKDDTILLCGNTVDDGETWMYLEASRHTDMQEHAKPFPNESEIDKMIDALRSNHKELIAEIQKHPSVVCVLYGCGFVEDSEI